ncbi:MAG: Rpn family recombination-promoting nuclease/putative transposase [Bacteroidales bacterium]|nr:Rpn family recombination-promoting nuclease/putative transposase [Bacteroidales bacterium]
MSKTTIKTLTQQLTDEQFALYRKMVDEHERYVALSEQQKRELLEDILCRAYMDLLCDWAFKHVFGHDKEALMMLLRDLLPLDIIDIEYESNELDRLHADAKASIMDVVCKLSNGERVIVEMQRELRDDFYDRMYFYGAASSIEQVKRGGDYSEIRTVFLIFFTNHVLKHTICPKDKLIFVYDFLEQETGEPYGEHPYFSIRLCELPRLAKTNMSEMTLVEQWFHLLKNIRTFALNPKDVPSRYQRILKSAQLAQITEEDRQNYLKNMLSEYDEKMISLGNYKRGHSDATEEIARRMLEDNEPMEKVVKFTGLTKEQIKAL